MTASEFAFLALGLVLGIASGSALVVVLGSRPPAREVKVTVERDAVPRRAATLSSDAFTAHSEPARGGPADRRRLDRDAPVTDPHPAPRPTGGLPGVPVMATSAAVARPVARPIRGAEIRTAVPSSLFTAAASAVTAPFEPDSGAPWGGIAVLPERDPSLDAIRIQAVLSALRAQRAGLRTATALLEARPIPEPEAESAAGRNPEFDPDEPTATDAPTTLVQILRGDQRALIRTVAVLAGDDVAMQRPWQAAITGLAKAVIRRSIGEGVLDFPVGNPFWDTFTTEQCRTVARALAACGYRFDGIDGWADERIPSYRDLTAAVAAAGLEPRRIRAWPTREEIAALYREVTVAADEYFAAQVPELELADVQALVGSSTPDLELLWRHWELARPVLAGPSVSASISN
jgi:hypothetical protein